MTSGRALLTWALGVLMVGCGGDQFASSGGAGTDAGLGGSAGSGGVAGVGGSAGSGAASSCAAGTKLCEGACVSVDDGAYGCSLDRCEPCQLPYADATCASGACSIASCDPGFDDCKQSEAGCETSLNTPENCGECGKSCPAGDLCDAGNCVSDCGSKTQCESSCVDLQTDVLNCGACGKACPSAPANATAQCEQGQCTIECKSGFADCTGGSGCETNINSNPSHCGACNSPCASAPAGAVAEQCAQAKCECPGARHPCPVGNETACVLIQQDPKFCSASCSSCNKGEACGTGQCQVGPCAWGMDQCNGSCVSLQSDPSHCGMCGNACGTGKGCKGGQCVDASLCDAGPCPGITLDGVACPNTMVDPANCGTCGKVCAPGQACQGGACVALEFAREPWECAGTACPVPGWWPINPAPLYCVTGNFCGSGSSN